MKNFKRIVGLLLCLAMMLSFVPVSVVTAAELGATTELVMQKIDLTDCIVSACSNNFNSSKSYRDQDWYTNDFTDFNSEWKDFGALVDGNYHNYVYFGCGSPERGDLYIDLTEKYGDAVPLDQLKLYPAGFGAVPTLYVVLELEGGRKIEKTFTPGWEAGDDDAEPETWTFGETYNIEGVYIWQKNNSVKAYFGEIELLAQKEVACEVVKIVDLDTPTFGYYADGNTDGTITEYYDASYGPANLIDGEQDTYTRSLSYTYSEIQNGEKIPAILFDLGKEFSLAGVKVNGYQYGQYNMRNFTIQVYDSTGTWTTVKTVTKAFDISSGKAGEETEPVMYRFDAIVGSKVRILVNSVNDMGDEDPEQKVSIDGFCVREISLYNGYGEAPEEETNAGNTSSSLDDLILMENAPAPTFGYYSDSDTDGAITDYHDAEKIPANMVNGDTGDYASSGYYTHAEIASGAKVPVILFDFGSKTILGGMDIYGYETSRYNMEDFEVQVYTSEGWVTAASVTDAFYQEGSFSEALSGPLTVEFDQLYTATKLRILVSGLSDMTQDAGEDATMAEGSKIRIREIKFYSEEAPGPYIETANLNGVDLSEYVIVYSDDEPDYNLRAAKHIRTVIKQRTGRVLEIVEDDVAEADCEILVGHTNRSLSQTVTAPANNVMKFTIQTSGTKIAMEADYFIIAGAAYYFAETYIDDASFDVTVSNVTRAPITEKANNYIMLIGDGMGVNQTKLFDKYDVPTSGDFAYSDGEDIFYGYYLPYYGLVKTSNSSGTVTDSAAGGTALATGYKTKNTWVGVDASGKSVRNLTELALSLGMGAAIMTTEEITGATPASFTSHVSDRANDDGILQNQATLRTQGAIIYNDAFYPDYSAAEWASAEPAFINVLNQVAKKDRFFLMYEEAYIDKNGHYSNAPWCFRTVYRFNQAIGFFMEFAMYNPDTLVVITADHETGNMDSTFTYDGGGAHSSQDVPIFAYGVGASAFDTDSSYHNTSIARTFAYMMTGGDTSFGDSQWPILTASDEEPVEPEEPDTTDPTEAPTLPEGGTLPQGQVYQIIDNQTYVTGDEAGYIDANGDFFPKDNCLADGGYGKPGYLNQGVTNATAVVARVTLSQSFNIGAIEVSCDRNTQNDPTDFEIQAYVDGEWVTVKTVTGAFTGTPRTARYTFDPVKTNQIRLYITSYEGDYCSIGEIEMYEVTTGNLVEEIDLTDRNVTADCGVTTDAALSTAVVGTVADGDKSTAVIFNSSTPTITIDLTNDDGTPTNVSAFSLFGYRSSVRPTSVEILLQTTAGGSYVSVGTYTFSKNTGDAYPFAPYYTELGASYDVYGLQIAVKGVNAGSQCALAEIELYGATAVPLSAPTGLTATTTTDTSIIVTADSITGGTLMFRINGGEWQTSGTFTGLDRNTTYTIDAMYVGAEGYTDSGISTITVTTGKTAQAAPAGFTATTTTDSSITVTANTSVNGTLQFRINGGEWQIGNTVTFTGLTRYTTYTIETMYVGINGYADSAVTTRQFTTAKTQLPKPTGLICTSTTDTSIVVTANNITGGTLMFRINKGVWQPSGIFNGLDSNTTYTIEAMYVGSTGYTDSAIASLTVATAKPKDPDAGQYAELEAIPESSITPHVGYNNYANHEMYAENTVTGEYINDAMYGTAAQIKGDNVTFTREQLASGRRLSVVFDLNNGVKKIGGVELTGVKGFNITKFLIQVKNGTGAWQTVRIVTANPFGNGDGTVLFTFTPREGDKVRIMIEDYEANANNAPEIREMIVYEAKEDAEQSKLTASSSVPAVVDGNKTTTYTGESVILTFDKPTPVKRVKLFGNTDADSVGAFTIDVQVNGQWQNGVYSGNAYGNARAFNTCIAVLNDTYNADAVRVNIFGKTIPEIELYGYLPAPEVVNPTPETVPGAVAPTEPTKPVVAPPVVTQAPTQATEPVIPNQDGSMAAPVAPNPVIPNDDGGMEKPTAPVATQPQGWLDAIPQSQITPHVGYYTESDKNTLTDENPSEAAYLNDAYFSTGAYVRGKNSSTSGKIPAAVMDLGGTKTIGGLLLVGKASEHITTFDIEYYSPATGKWELGVSVTSDPFTENSTQTFLFAQPVECTQVRVLVKTFKGSNPMLQELNVLELKTGNELVQIPLENPAVNKKPNDSSCDNEYIADGDLHTFYDVHPNQLPAEFTATLATGEGIPTTVSRVKVFTYYSPSNGAPNKIKIELKVGGSWTEAYNGVAYAADAKDTFVCDLSKEYAATDIRLTVSSRNGDNAATISDIQVFGPGEGAVGGGASGSYTPSAPDMDKIDLTGRVQGADSQGTSSSSDYTNLTWYTDTYTSWRPEWKTAMVDGNPDNDFHYGISNGERADFYLDLTNGAGGYTAIDGFKMIHSGYANVPEVTLILVTANGNVEKSYSPNFTAKGQVLEDTFDQTYNVKGVYVWENGNTVGMNAAFGEFELYKKQTVQLTTPASLNATTVAENSITVTAPAITTGGTLKYRINGGTWQTSGTFEGLTAGTAYTIDAMYVGAAGYTDSGIKTITVTTATPVITEFAVNGTVNVAGAIVRLCQNGAEIAQTTTDANGEYSFSNVAIDNYTLVVSKQDYTTESAVITVSTGNVTKDFTLTALRYTISGQVISNGNAVADATVRLCQNGVEITRTTTNASGEYSFGGVASGNYTVLVTKQDHTTESATVTVNGANATANITLTYVPPVVFEPTEDAVALAYYNVHLVEPWALRVNFTFYTAENGTALSLSSFNSYGAYAVIAGEYGEGVPATWKDIVNNPNATQYRMGDGTGDYDIYTTNGTTAVFDFYEGLYTYRMAESVYWVAYYEDAEGNFHFTEVRKPVVTEKIDSIIGNSTSESEIRVLNTMKELHAALIAFRGADAELGKEYADGKLNYGLDLGAVNNGTYRFGKSHRIRLIEPWGLMVSYQILNKSTATTVDLSTYQYNFGMIFYHDKTGEYNGNMTASQMIARNDVYVFSKDIGNIKLEDGKMVAVYDENIFTSQMDSDIYCLPFIVDENGDYHYSTTANCMNLLDEMYVFYNRTNLKNEERITFRKMIELYKNTVIHFAK